MYHSNKTIRQIGNSKAPFKLVDLGECRDKTCPDFNQDEFHSHALMYVTGSVQPEVADMMKETIHALGFVGDLDVECMSVKKFQYHMKKIEAIQKHERRKERYNQRYKDSLEADAEFMATIQERDQNA